MSSLVKHALNRYKNYEQEEQTSLQEVVTTMVWYTMISLNVLNVGLHIYTRYSILPITKLKCNMLMMVPLVGSTNHT